MNYRNEKLLRRINELGASRDLCCTSCGCFDGTVVAAHSNQLRDGKGRGIKAHDYRVAALCNRCHYLCDQGRELTEEQKKELWEEAHRVTVGLLFTMGVIQVK